MSEKPGQNEPEGQKTGDSLTQNPPDALRASYAAGSYRECPVCHDPTCTPWLMLEQGREGKAKTRAEIARQIAMIRTLHTVERPTRPAGPSAPISGCFRRKPGSPIRRPAEDPAAEDLKPTSSTAAAAQLSLFD